MFTSETLSGQKRQLRPKGSDAEIKAIQNKAIRLKMFLYKKEIHDSAVKMIRTSNANNPPEAVLGKLAADIMVKFEKDGGYINDPDVLEGLSKMLIKELLTLAVAAGVVPENAVNAETLFAIVGIAQQHWDKANPSRVDKGRAERMMQEGSQNPAVQQALSAKAQQDGANAIGQRPAQQPPAAPQPEQQPVPAPAAPQPGM